MNLFRKKPIGFESNAHGLVKCLSAFDLTLLGIGAIIGTGIFVLTGHAAANEAGPAVVISYIVAGVVCAFAALAYSELAASVGGAGSAYGYSYAAFGELIAWIIGWDLILEYGVSVAAVANGWSGYFKDFMTSVHMPIPAVLTKGPWAIDAVTKLSDPGIINLPAVGIILILMIMLIMGIKGSARLNTGIVFIKFATILTFIGVAIFHVNFANWDNFMPFGWFSYVDDGNGGFKPIGILAGASVVFFAYVGFDAVSTAVEEAKNPQRDVPIGILTSLVFCTIVYIIVAGLLTLIAPYTKLGVSSPVSQALLDIGSNLAAALVSSGVIFGLLAVMLVLYYALTRVIMSMSVDGLLPSFLGRVSQKTHTPVRNTVITGCCMAFMAGMLPLGMLAEMVSIGTLAAFVLVCGGVIVLRIKHPDLPRPFKAPGGLAVPTLGILFCLALCVFLPWQAQARFVGWLAIGMVIYFAYSVKRSRLNIAE